MPNNLLLGAGFSKNWGAPLASEFFDLLIADEAVDKFPELKKRLWDNHNFEEVLGELQNIDPAVDRWAQYQLNTLSLAINRIFARINDVLFNTRFEWAQHADKQLGYFLTKFDAIFTLNQDLLIERHYLDGNGMHLLDRARRFDGCFTPGLVRTGQQRGAANVTGWDFTTTMPLDVSVPARTQPYYKLHGSTNWHTFDRPNFLVMGGGKAELIAKIPLLNQYYETFKTSLNAPNSKLIIIGYGFGDEHINDALSDAVLNHGLRFALNARSGDAIVTKKPALKDMFRTGCRTFVRSVLPDIFSDADNLDFRALQDFMR